MKKFETIKEKNGILINKVSGKITADDIYAHLINATLNMTNIPVLWDFTDADIGKLTYEELIKMAKKLKPYAELRAGARTALVARYDVPFDMMKILNKMAEECQASIHFRSFKEIDRATEWLATSM